MSTVTASAVSRSIRSIAAAQLLGGPERVDELEVVVGHQRREERPHSPQGPPPPGGDVRSRRRAQPFVVPDTQTGSPALRFRAAGALHSWRVDVVRRNNVKTSGRPDGRAIVFAHGFGCDQHMWRFVAPAFEADHRVVLFDHVGAGASDLAAYDPERYGSLEGYADDVVEICRALDARPTPSSSGTRSAR